MLSEINQYVKDKYQRQKDKDKRQIPYDLIYKRNLMNKIN